MVSEKFSLVHQTSNTRLFMNIYLLIYLFIYYMPQLYKKNITRPRAEKCNTRFFNRKKIIGNRKFRFLWSSFCTFPQFMANKPSRPQTTPNQHLLILQRTYARSYLQFRLTRYTQKHRVLPTLSWRKEWFDRGEFKLATLRSAEPVKPTDATRLD